MGSISELGNISEHYRFILYFWRNFKDFRCICWQDYEVQLKVIPRTEKSVD